VKLRIILSVEEVNSHAAGRDRVENIVGGFNTGEE
jgi:hypothetical protein